MVQLAVSDLHQHWDLVIVQVEHHGHHMIIETSVPQPHSDSVQDRELAYCRRTFHPSEGKEGRRRSLECALLNSRRLITQVAMSRAAASEARSEIPSLI